MLFQSLVLPRSKADNRKVKYVQTLPQPTNLRFDRLADRLCIQGQCRCEVVVVVTNINKYETKTFT